MEMEVRITIFSFSLFFIFRANTSQEILLLQGLNQGFSSNDFLPVSKIQWQGVIGYKMAVLQKVLEGVIRDTGDFQTSFDKGDRAHFFRIIVCSQMHINSLSILNLIDLIKTNQQTKKSPWLQGTGSQGTNSQILVFFVPYDPLPLYSLSPKRNY